jgi:hypothetical protein
MAYRNRADQQAAWRRYYRKNKQRVMARNKRVKEALLAEIRNYKAQRPCADCQQKYHPVCMDFDHVRGEKVGDVSQLVADGNTSKLWAEVEKCDVVCSNCHRLRTYYRQQAQLEIAA